MVRVGILGGGQLALMTAEAAPALGVDVVVLEREAESPAGRFVGAPNEIVGHWSERRALETLADRVDLITLESEFVDADTLQWLVDRGTPVLPEPRAVGLIQDKLVQKQTLAAAGLPVAPFAPIESNAEVEEAAREHGWPLVLKTRRSGYDGYGNALLRSSDDVDEAMARLSRGTGAGGAGGLYLEAWQPFSAELAVMVARSTSGEVATFPVVTTVQRDGICHEVIAPADHPDAAALAARAVEAVGLVGVVGIELFLLGDGRVLVNELAPRPHNSGHYSIEGCRTSQFTNHLLAILGRQLGPTDLVPDGAAMVNLLGTANGPAAPRGVEAAAEQQETFVHIYGKRDVRVGRKMGHVTSLADSPEQAIDRARTAARMIEW